MVHTLIVATCPGSINGFLACFHLGSGKMWVSAIHGAADCGLNQRQARIFAMHVDEHDLPCELVMRDNDKQYPKTFDNLFTTTTCKLKRKLPSLTEPAGVVQTFKHEGNAPSGTNIPPDILPNWWSAPERRGKRKLGGTFQRSDTARRWEIL